MGTNGYSYYGILTLRRVIDLVIHNITCKIIDYYVQNPYCVYDDISTIWMWPPTTALNKTSIYSSSTSNSLPYLVSINSLKASHFCVKLLLLLIYVCDALNSYNYLDASFTFYLLLFFWEILFLM